MKRYEKIYYVYIMASSSGTLYIGMINNLLRRAQEHKQKLIPGFTKKYGCNKLVYFEQGDSIEEILNRKTQYAKQKKTSNY